MKLSSLYFLSLVARLRIRECFSSKRDHYLLKIPNPFNPIYRFNPIFRCRLIDTELCYGNGSSIITKARVGIREESQASLFFHIVATEAKTTRTIWHGAKSLLDRVKIEGSWKLRSLVAHRSRIFISDTKHKRPCFSGKGRTRKVR